MLLTKSDLRGVEAHLLLVKDPVLREVVVQVTTVHQVQDEAELVWRVEGVRHTYDKRAVHLSGGEREALMHRKLLRTDKEAEDGS